MTQLAFYRQGRRDGGIRTGIEIERDTVLGRFEEGTDEFDPVLTWSLDIECQGDSLPAEPEGARRWFLDQAGMIRGALNSLAELLGVGLDIDSWPFRQKFSQKIEGQDVSIEVTCSALRHFEARHIAERVRDVAERWEDLIRSLPAVEEITL